jgi:hypothetical protein
MNSDDNLIEKSTERLQAEEAARDALRKYCRGYGRQSELCRATGIHEATMSRMKSGKGCKGGTSTINLEHAIAIEIASKGKLRAEILCPEKAHLLEAMFRQRYG